MKKTLSLVLTVVMSLGLLSGCGKSAATTDTTKGWTPSKEITFVVPSSAGGGSDLNARTIADIAYKNKFSSKNFMVNNMGGGSGAVAFSYVGGKKGDPNTLMVLHSGQIMGSYVNDWDVKADSLTDISVVALDDLLLCVNSDSKYKDLNSLLTAIKANPESIKFGGSQRGNGDHLGFLLLNKYTDSKFTYVQFNSTGDVTSALLGKHIDVGIFNPSECIGQIQAGKLTPLVTYSDKRLTGDFKDVPTFTELGYKDIQEHEIRAIAGPADMPAEAVKFYEDMIKKVTETEEWKTNYIAKNNLTPVYMNAADSKKFLDEQVELYKKSFKDVGLIK